MKRLIYLVPFLLMGCVHPFLQTTEYYYKNFKSQEPLTVTAGSEMLIVEFGDKNKEGYVIHGERYALTYLGIENNVISAEYKRYMADMGRWYVRDAYTKIMKFDMSQSKEIAFGNINLEVLNVGNKGITFKVLNPDDPELEKKYGKTNQQGEISKGTPAVSNR